MAIGVYVYIVLARASACRSWFALDKVQNVCHTCPAYNSFNSSYLLGASQALTLRGINQR